MKKFLFGISGLFVAVLMTVLILPGFIDWNEYKTEIAAQAKAMTGRALVINGDIKLALLPSPALVAEDVRLTNIEGAAESEMVRLKSLQVRIALGPLLSGEFQVETLKLIEPVIALETLADGRQNWILTPPQDEVSSTTKSAESQVAENADGAAAGGGLRPGVRIDSFVIVNGSVIYRDSRKGTVQRIEAIDARIAAASLTGPFDSDGQLQFGGIPLGYEISVGKVIHGRTVPFTMRVDMVGAAAGVQVDGTLVSLSDAPKVKGTVKVRGANLAGVINSLAAAGPLPGILNQGFDAEGTMVASADGIEIKGVALNLGDNKVTANLSVALREIPAIAANLSIARVDLDRWLALPPSDGLADMANAREEARAEREERTRDASVRGKASVVLDPVLKKTPLTAGASGFALPTSINGSFGLSADAVTFHGGLIRRLRANAELSGGEVTISQLSAQFPGSSELALFGFISAVDGAPRFEGEIESSVSDLRRVMDWLGIVPPRVPADRLRKLTLNSRLIVTPAQIEVSGLTLNLDSSRLTGAATVALRERPAFGANITIDRLNLDAYLPSPTPSSSGNPARAAGVGKEIGVTPSAVPSQGSSQGSSQGPSQGPSQAETAFAAWRVLTGVDANLVAQVKSAVYNRTPIKGVVFDGTLFNGSLEVRRAAVADLAGAKVLAKGTIKGFSSIPVISGFDFDVTAGDLSRLFRLAGIEPPVSPKKLGAVSIKGTLDGSVLKPRFGLNIKAAGAQVGVSGSVSALGPTIDAKIKMRHADLPALLRALDVNYRPAKTKLGGLDIAATVKGNPASLTFSQMVGKIGSISVAGGGTLAMSGPRPKIVADVQTGEIVIQDLLPAKRTAMMLNEFERRFGRPGIVPASWPAVPRPTIPSAAIAIAAGGRWPKEALDLSVLKAFDADMKIKSAAITFDQYTVRNADVAATVADGVLRAERIVGVLYGGPLAGKAIVAASPVPRINVALQVKNVNVRQALKAVTGKGMADGSLDLDVKLSGSGRSVADIIATLDGGGALALRKLDVKGSAKGTALSGVLNLLVSLNRLGGGKGGALADVTGSFDIDRGVARSKDMRLVSSLGQGQAQGLIDLPRWYMDVQGEVRLAKNVLTDLLAQATKTQVAAQALPFHIKGNLDSPNVKLDTSSLSAAGRGLAIPGIDKLFKKKGIGNILQKIIPGAQTAPQTAPSSSQNEPPPPPTEKKKVRPEDILRGLFKKLR